MEIQMKIELQDAAGQSLKELVVGVPEDITARELLEGLHINYPNYVKKKSSIFMELPDNKPVSSRLITDGIKIIVRPKTTEFKIIEEN